MFDQVRRVVIAAQVAGGTVAVASATAEQCHAGLLEDPRFHTAVLTLLGLLITILAGAIQKRRMGPLPIPALLERRHKRPGESDAP